MSLVRTVADGSGTLVSRLDYDAVDLFFHPLWINFQCVDTFKCFSLLVNAQYSLLDPQLSSLAIIVSNLKEYVKKKGLPKGLTLGSCSILETVGQGALASLYQTLQSAIGGKDSESSTSGKIIWLHFGVNSGATRFAIEHQAVNEATFRCPEELGWKPQKLPIIPADGDISHTRQVAWISFFMIFLIKRVS
ncbi:uncharacterized protein LOC112021583 [Quercus suber]|uniref:uncharacterized protein LOC112021583 n=1 Tax=Quercus suber TaxID=58331 RepID=UPI0032DF27F9